MPESDWDIFRTYVTWFVKRDEDALVHVNGAAAPTLFTPNAAFRNRFPQTTTLLHASRVSVIEVEEEIFHLHTWPVANQKGLCGWLCERPLLDSDTQLHPDHRLLLQCFGGVRECFNEPPKTWLQNLNWSICASRCKLISSKEVAGLREYVVKVLRGRDCLLLQELENCVRFASEANGNFTAYNRASGDVIMCAPDHCFSHLETIAGCPEYSFYRIPAAPRFSDWVEEVSKQWLNHITE